MTTPIKSSWQLFIDKFIETGDHIMAYSAAYPGVTRKVAATKGKALLNRSEISREVDRIQSEKRRRIGELRDGELTASQKNGVLSEVELDLLLSQIARGDIRFPKMVIARDGSSVEVMIGPDISDRIAAIDKLYKRLGSYSPSRQDAFPKSDYAGWSNEQLEAELKRNMEILND